MVPIIPESEKYRVRYLNRRISFLPTVNSVISALPTQVININLLKTFIFQMSRPFSGNFVDNLMQARQYKTGACHSSKIWKSFLI